MRLSGIQVNGLPMTELIASVFDVANFAGGGVADPELDAIRCRIQKREVFSVVAPFDAADLCAGRNLDLALSEPSAMRLSVKPTEY